MIDERSILGLAGKVALVTGGGAGSGTKPSSRSSGCTW